MREILFRGKRVDTKEWVYGGYQKRGKNCFIPIADKHGSTDCFYLVEVTPETVGQYTGLTDKNGKKIFEGDIVKGTALSRDRIGVIVWICEIAGFGVKYIERNDPTAWEKSSILKNIARHNFADFCAEIIGNIYDNPEPLKEEQPCNS